MDGQTNSSHVLVIAPRVTEDIIAVWMRREGALPIPFRLREREPDLDRLVNRLDVTLRGAIPAIAFIAQDLYRRDANGFVLRDVDGVELTRALRQQARFSGMKIIIVGQRNFVGMFRARLAGAHDYAFLPLVRLDILDHYHKHRG